MLFLIFIICLSKCVRLKVKDKLEWNPPKEKISGEAILNAYVPTVDSIDEIIEIPSFNFEKYSYVLTNHNSYYFIPGGEKYYYVNGTNTIRGEGCRNAIKASVEENEKNISFYYCKSCKPVANPLFFLPVKNSLLIDGLKIEWTFIETHEVNVPIGFEKEHEYAMPETKKVNGNNWKFSFISLEDNAVIAENDYWENSITREPYRISYLSKKITTEIHDFDTYNYVVFYEFRKGDDAVSIKCNNYT